MAEETFTRNMKIEYQIVDGQLTETMKSGNLGVSSNLFPKAMKAFYNEVRKFSRDITNEKNYKGTLEFTLSETD